MISSRSALPGTDCFRAATGAYVLGSPSVSQAVLTRAGVKNLTIGARINSLANKYISGYGAMANPTPSFYITHRNLLRGGQLVLALGPSPIWGVAPADRPHSELP